MSAPEYILLISDLAGEQRFATIVVKPLESLGALTHGDRRVIVRPSHDYKGDFFKDIADGLVGVGLITQDADMPGSLTLDKGYNEMSKFLNRILGMHVDKQNMLFKYFSDTLQVIITQAKRTGRYDKGILDVGVTKWSW